MYVFIQKCTDGRGMGIHDLLRSDWSEEQWLSDNFRQYLNIRGFEFTFVDG